MLRLLVVDDHEFFRMGLKRLFSGRVDIEVAEEASSGAAALSAIRREAFDVALLDLTLPDMSGMEVLSRAKAIRPETAILIVSGYPEDQFAINVLKAGAAGVRPPGAATRPQSFRTVPEPPGGRGCSAPIIAKARATPSWGGSAAPLVTARL